MKETMQKLLLLLLLAVFFFNPAQGQEHKAEAGSMPITISNCKFTWGILKYKGCYGAAEKGGRICIGQYEFQQSIDQNNMVSTTQIFIKEKGQIVPKRCDSKIITEDW